MDSAIATIVAAQNKNRMLTPLPASYWKSGFRAKSVALTRCTPGDILEKNIGSAHRGGDP
jgi:hypothetical protein